MDITTNIILLSLSILVLLIILLRKNSTSTARLQQLEQDVIPGIKLLGTHHIRLGRNEDTINEEDPIMLRSLTFPPRKDLWADAIVKTIEVDNQGQYGSCTAHALSYAWQQAVLRAGGRLNNGTYYRPSRCFWYAESRRRLGDTNYAADNGSTIEATAWTLSNRGALPEINYPYTNHNMDFAVPLPIETLAVDNKRATLKIRFSSNFKTNLTNFKTQLSMNRLIMIGIMVYSSFMKTANIKSGNIPIPNRSREQLLGGHAIALSGWDDATKTFTFRNSWGRNVGVNGLFKIPYDYICDPRLSGDAWVVI